jgi:hypothetical protein
MFLIRFLFIFLAFHCISQVHNLERLPTPRIDENNLQTLLTNDGKELILLDTSELKEWRLNSLYSKKPAVVKLNKNEYLYNYYAVQNNLLCPSGKRVINIDDINKLSIVEYDNYDFNKKVNYIDIEGSCQSKEITYKINNDRILGLSSNITIKNPDDSKFQSVIFPTGNYYESFLYESNDFLPTRCVEDITYTIRNNIFSYQELKPNYFNEFKSKISKEILFRSNVQNSEFGSGVLKIEFNNLGKITSSFSASSNLTFWNNLNPLIVKKETLESPYHGDYFIATKDILKISIINKSSYIEKKNKYLKDINFDILFSNEQNKSIFPVAYNYYKKKSSTFNNLTILNKEKFKNEIFIDNEKQKLPLYYASKFQVPGAFAPLKSFVFPGLGSKKLNFNKSYRIHRNLAFIAIATFASSLTISEIYYQKYTSSIKTDPYGQNYKIANMGHKISLISLGLYPVISLSDIISCYITCKKNGISLFGNKRMQHKMNRELRQNRINGKYLCLD